MATQGLDFMPERVKLRIARDQEEFQKDVESHRTERRPTGRRR